jgi:putative transposase
MAHGVNVGHKRVERFLRQAGLSGLISKRRGRTTIRVPGMSVADDLVKRRSRPEQAKVLWFTDITYLRTREGVAVSRRRPERVLPTDRWRADDARSHAPSWSSARSRWPSAARRPAPGLIHHSDQGSQLVALGFAGVR